MYKLILLFLALMSSNNLYAGSASSGTLFNFHFMNNGVIIVYTTGTRSGVPACASSQPQRFALDATTTAGKTQLSGLISAHAAKKPITIYGTGACTAYGDSETINFFYVQ